MRPIEGSCFFTIDAPDTGTSTDFAEYPANFKTGYRITGRILILHFLFQYRFLEISQIDMVISSLWSDIRLFSVSGYFQFPVSKKAGLSGQPDIRASLVFTGPGGYRYRV
jgi:hypothetical protein